MTDLKRAVRANFDASPSSYRDYEARTGRFAALARRLLDRMTDRRGGEPFGRLLDAGAGTGASTAVLREHAGSVVALDASRPMLRENGAPDRVRGDIERLPFRAGTFDGVAFTASLFLVPDPAAAAAEAARVLRPGGVVGAVAPLGWRTPDGRDAFADLERESRSPMDAADVAAGLDAAFTVETGVWAFESTADDVRAFHATPAGAARLFPKLPPDERVERARAVLADLDGPVEHRWRWFVATP